MRPFSTAIGSLVLGAMLVSAPAGAQGLDLRPDLTQRDFEQFAANLASTLRFRQLGDATPLGRGHVDLGVVSASTRAFPRILARFGVTDHVDVGAWGGVDRDLSYGIAGIDTTIALMTQGAASPVTVSVRPNFTALIDSGLWAGTLGIDLSISHAFGSVSPYAGIGATTSGAVEQSNRVDLDPVSAGHSLAFAGLSYRWRTIVLSAEVEKAQAVSYAFRIGKRF